MCTNKGNNLQHILDLIFSHEIKLKPHVNDIKTLYDALVT